MIVNHLLVHGGFLFCWTSFIFRIFFLGKQELSFQGHDESAGSNNRQNFVELLSLIAESNTDLHYLSINKVLSGTSGKIQNNLITAIAEVMGEEVRSEVKKALLVSVMVDETTHTSNTVQLALVLHYLTDTGLKERLCVSRRELQWKETCSPLICLLNKSIYCGYRRYLSAMKQLFILYFCIWHSGF